MWPSREDKGKNITIPYSTMVAIIISVITLAISAGLIRWSWLLLDEQVRLRKDFVDLSAKQDQMGVQYEFWLEQLQKERDAVKE